MDNKLTSKAYWDASRKAFKPFLVNENMFSEIFIKFLPKRSDFICTEVGAYPGAHLVYLAKNFEYKPIAIEYSEYTSHIEELFRFNGIYNYSILNEDFLKLNHHNSFDVVTSFGFIEHFINYREVLAQHVNLLKDDGYLVISVPYIGGLQGILRRVFYKPKKFQEVLRTHNLSIMNLEEIKKISNELNLEILFLDYCMSTTIWFSWRDSFIRKRLKLMLRIINAVEKRVRRKLPSSALYSPMILLIARKKSLRILD